MKLKYIIPSLIALLAFVLVSCEKDDDKTYLDGLRVSQSYVSLDVNGGSAEITLTADGDWAFEDQKWIQKKDTTIAPAPKWLKIDPVKGSAGVTKITFSADSTIDGRTVELKMVSGGKVQLINVIQGVATVSDASCKDVIAGPDSKTYRVKGVVTKIANTTYGNWYLNDGTGEIYVYGTLDAKGATKNFLSLGIEVGDEVTVEGPKTTYNGTVELVDVTVVKIAKSLIKVDSLSVKEALPVEGGLVTAYLTNKAGSYSVEIPEDAQDWLFIKTFDEKSMTFRALANAGGDRSTTVTFKATQDGKTYTSQVDISQKGAILEVSIADFLAAEVGDTQYRLTGVITELYASDKQGKSFYIADHSGKTLVYRAEGFIEAGAKVGDVVTVVGKRGAYKETPQLVSGTFENLAYSVETKSIADFKNLPDDKEKYYMISGTIRQTTDAEKELGAKDDIAQYGNFYLVDEEGNDIYVYGVLTGWGGQKGEFGKLGLTFGDKLTILAYKTTYKGLVEAVGTYFSHEKAQAEE